MHEKLKKNRVFYVTGSQLQTARIRQILAFPRLCHLRHMKIYFKLMAVY